MLRQCTLHSFGGRGVKNANCVSPPPYDFLSKMLEHEGVSGHRMTLLCTRRTSVRCMLLIYRKAIPAVVTSRFPSKIIIGSVTGPEATSLRRVPGDLNLLTSSVFLSWELISSGIIVMRFKSQTVNLTMVAICTPTLPSKCNVKDEFYDSLQTDKPRP